MSEETGVVEAPAATMNEIGTQPFTRAAGELRATNRTQLELMRVVLERGAQFRFAALGFSMAPFIRDGDVLTVAPLQCQRLRAGDVVAFVRPETGSLLVHRIIAEQDRGMLLRGDNCRLADGVIERSDVLGRVTHVQRADRTVRLGLGPERRLIALLSARGWLLPIRACLELCLHPASALLDRLQRITAYRAVARRIRPAFVVGEADSRDLMALRARLLPDADSVSLPPPSAAVTLYMARCGRRVAGCAQLGRHPREHHPYTGHWLWSLRVRMRYRGMGVGTALVRRIIDQATTEGAPELRTRVFADNWPAIRLYRKLGFEPAVLLGIEAKPDDTTQAGARRIIVLRLPLAPLPQPRAAPAREGAPAGG